MLPATPLNFMQNDEWYRYDEKIRKYVITEKAPKRAVESHKILYSALANRYCRVRAEVKPLPSYIVCSTHFWILHPMMEVYNIVNIDSSEFPEELEEFRGTFYETKIEEKFDSHFYGAGMEEPGSNFGEFREGETNKELDLNGMETMLIKDARNAVATGLYMPCGTDADELYSYFLVHEAGHMLQNKLFYDELVKHGWSPDDMMKFVDESYTDPDDPRRYKWYYDILEEATARHRKEIIAIAKETNPDFSEIKNMSKVAMMNDEEFFAEAYANSELSMPNEIGRAMAEWLKENEPKPL